MADCPKHDWTFRLQTRCRTGNNRYQTHTRTGANVDKRQQQQQRAKGTTPDSETLSYGEGRHRQWWSYNSRKHGVGWWLESVISDAVVSPERQRCRTSPDEISYSEFARQGVYRWTRTRQSLDPDVAERRKPSSTDVTFELDLHVEQTPSKRTTIQNVSVAKLLSDLQTHIHTGAIALAGLIKWWVKRTILKEWSKFHI